LIIMSSRKQPAGFFALFIAMGMLLLIACPVSAQEATPGAADAALLATFTTWRFQGPLAGPGALPARETITSRADSE